MNITHEQLFKFADELKEHERTCGCVLEMVTTANYDLWHLPIGTAIRWRHCPERERLSLILHLAGYVHAGTATSIEIRQLQLLLNRKEVSTCEL